ncbi:MAG: glycoside hydrolase family 9 protein [Fimbriimonas sp.]
MIVILGLLTATMPTQDYPTYAVPRLAGVTIPGLPPVIGNIRVDQFGYLPSQVKVAVIADPKLGFNSGDHYTPPATLELRERVSGKVVFSAKPTVWANGKTHEDSGDRGWWFDFTSVQTPGEYYVFDPVAKKRSPVVRINETVFAPVLKAATRMFYYQRLGVPLLAKHAGTAWAEAAALTQDARARNVLAKNDVSQQRDLGGGWMDAGDTNKYPPFNGDVLHPMLYGYRSNPSAFGDANNIPESGNGLPDILDEIKVQLDWLVKMQFPDGAVPVKMGNIDYSGKFPLSEDKRARYYGPKDSGAAIYTAANFAHAARVYAKFPQWKGFSDDLRRRAILSWNWYQTNPKTYKSDTGEIKSGIANRNADEQTRMEAFAAIHLFALTGEQKYHNVVKAKAPKARQLSEGIWSPYDAGTSEALAEYTTFPNADAALVARIKKQLRDSANNSYFAPPVESDLYRAWMVPTSYHWGSNYVRAAYGFTALLAADYGGVDAATKSRLRIRAAGMLHSFHGVNPLGMVYLSNMKQYGAELSASTIYHERYNTNSPLTNNPAPGYVVGGPNQSFTGTAAAGSPSVDWLKKQPRAKAYADFNKGWPESSWEISEPAIYYQAMYIRLLSAFAK